MDIKKVKLSELKPDKKNARKHDKRNIEEIKRSLQKNPQYRPFVVQKSTGRILVGNGMYQAMKELGITEGWVEYRDLNDEDATVLALSDNRTAELADWDTAVLKNLLEEMGPDIDVPGWDTSEIEGLFSLPSDGVRTEIIEDEAPEPQSDTVSQLGDVWLLGQHRLMCGDSTKEGDVAVLMGGAMADMVFTDPPYNVDYSSKNTYLNAVAPGNRIQTPIENDNYADDGEIAEKIWGPAFANMRAYAAPHCSIYCTMPQGGAHMMMMMMMASAHWQVKHELIWLKNNHVLGRADYLYKHEPILFGWAEKHCFYGKGEFTKSVWEIPKPQKSDLHPTMKPVSLIVNALLNSSQVGEFVLDLFGGSGSTLIACEQTGRVCYMMELSPHYVDVIIRRWQALTGGKAIHEKTGEIFPG
ncbi:DNA modification methylase [Cloacibacillus sp. An23]|uniref:DNA modification methylase n=1 Tax=Cloacibacillus sp. An23 TaxID=1965591 RepID=UPI000B3A0440|nr:DNA modification methylase [Cloacibacillus sp. An23]OUO94793.1 hypothetical protein B5F39_02680 [Cloacibacillus sp. An23]